MTLGLARFEADSGKAAQIITRDQDGMARAAKRFEDALVKQANAASRLSPEFKIVEAAMLGLGDSTISLIKSLSSTSGAFASVSASGATAFNSISGAAAGAASAVDQRIALIVAKVREARAQAEGLRESAKGENSAGTLSDDGLKQKLAGIKLTQAAYAELAKSGIAQELAAQQVAEAEAATLAKRTAAFERLRATVEKLNFEKSRSDAGAERISSSKGAVSAIDGAATAQASAQSQVYLASLIAIAAQADVDAQAEARRAAALSASGAASERAQAAQQVAYTTKTAYIAKVNEEAAALFRTADAQRQLDAERAGVSPQQAAQLAKFSGDREFTSTIYQAIAAEQKKSVEFGKSATEIFKQDAALRGLTNTTASAISRFDALAVANQKVAASAAKSSEDTAFLQGLKNTEAQIGKTRAELLAYQATQRGLGKEAAGTIASIAAKDLKVAREGFNAAGNAAEHFGLQSVGAKRELLVLAHELSQGNYSRFGGSLLVLAERTNALELVTGTLSGGIGRSVLAIGGAVAAVGALAVSYAVGAHESKAFADSLVLTGNYAGITEGQYNSLAKSIAASGHVTVGAAREFGQALISTGEIGPRVIGAATAAAALYGKATGKTAQEVASDFATMSQGVAKYAATHNQSLNFISAAQYQQIKLLEDQGRAAEAQGLVYDALTTRFNKLGDNLGYLGSILSGTKNLWSRFWDSAFDIGRAETIEDKIARAAAAVGAIDARLAQGRQANQAFSSAPPLREDDSAEKARVASLKGTATANLIALERKKLRQDDAAFAEGDRAQDTKSVIAFKEKLEGLLVKGKSQVEYQKELLKLQKGFRDSAAQGVPVTGADQKVALAELKKQFTDQPAVSRADSQRKSTLAKDLQGFAADLAKETDVLKFHQSELQAIYSAGNLSLAQFYDDKVKTAAEGVQAEIAAQNKATARLNAELAAGKFKDPHERTDTERQRNESIAKSENLIRDARHAAALATYERAAAEKALTDRVVDFRAQLLQAEGDDAGAAALRARQAIDAARLFAKASQGSASPVSDDDLARLERTIKVRDALAQVSGRVSIATADATRSEEIFLLLATRGGADLATQDQGLLKIRSKLVEQLGEAARKTQVLAEAAIAAAKVSGGVVDPKVLTEAANAARDYVIALSNVDPAYKRLQDAGQALGTSIAGTLGGAIAKFTSLKDAARAVGHQIFESLTQQFVTAPLEKQIQGILGKIIDGDNPVSAALRSAAGAQDTGVRAAQTAAITASTNALVTFSNAANSAALSFGPSTAKFAGTSTDPSAANYENSSDQSSTAAEAAKSLGAFGKTTSTTADLFTGAVSTLVSSTGRAGAAIAGLPGVISNISSYVYSLLQSVSGGSSGGAGSLISSLFGASGGSSVGSSASYAANDFIAAANGQAFSTSGVQAFARGDVFNTPTAFRFARGGGFANGVMGEAGPEAVMPLRRGADGKLGVASAGGSSANVYYLNVTTQAAPNMSRDTALQQGANIGAGIQRALARNG